MNNLHGKFDEMVQEAQTSSNGINRLYYGDCLTIMKYLPNNSVDLIYLDPPFNSNRDYHSIYEDETGRPLPEQIQAFSDMWEPNDDTWRAVREIPDIMLETHADKFGIDMWEVWVNALRNSQPSMLAYLAYMAERLLLMRMLLKPTGALYFHCDPTASHYIKVFLDGAFGHKNFRNEISWVRSVSKQKGSQYEPRQWGNNRDIIFFYAKTSMVRVKPYRELTDDERSEKFDKVDDDGRRYHNRVALYRGQRMGPRPNLCYEWRGFKNRSSAGWRLSKARLEEEYQKGNVVIKQNGKLERRKYETDYKGVPVGNNWDDILPALGKEYMGYSTQKPIKLLERIIESSCPPDGVVLDPFCGCGTTMEAAHRLGRRWIGIDIAIHAINRVTRSRLEDRLGLTEGEDFVVAGVPSSVESARTLWERDPYHFQTWAVEIADGFVTTKRGRDGGVDGRLYFEEDVGEGYKHMVLQVKGGKNVGGPDAQRLAGVLHGSDADLAGLIVMDLTDKRRKNIETEMKKHGEAVFHGYRYSKMQLLTVEELLEGKRFDTPPVRGKQPTFQGRL